MRKFCCKKTRVGLSGSVVRTGAAWLSLALAGCGAVDEDRADQLSSAEIQALTSTSGEVTAAEVGREQGPSPSSQADGGGAAEGTDGSTQAVDLADESRQPVPSIPGLGVFGTGCTADDTTLSVDADGKSVIAEFRQMSLFLTSGSRSTSADKMCVIDVPLKPTQETTYALQEIVMTGNAAIPEDMEFSAVSFLRTSGIGMIGEQKRTVVRGPQSGDFSLRVHFEAAQAALPCGPAGLQAAVSLIAVLNDAKRRARAGSATLSRVELKFAEVSCMK
jgi:hypothetical protein